MTPPASTRADRAAAIRDAIREASAALFAERGFSATSVRDIAAIAETDPALVIRYFGSKEGLFLETMVLPSAWSTALEGPLETLAEDLLRFALDPDRPGEGGKVLAALVRASDRPEVGASLRRFTQELFVDRLVPRMDGEDRILRAHLFAAGFTGLQVAVLVAGDDAISSESVDTVVAAYAPGLQLILTGAGDGLRA